MSVHAKSPANSSRVLAGQQANQLLPSGIPADGGAPQQLSRAGSAAPAPAAPLAAVRAAGQPASVSMSWRGRRMPSAQPHGSPAQAKAPVIPSMI
ncbi:hypothetical protein HaLaN_24160 [Haematococcus lacustris]|uniref:Uncharacterized protein n=1 Tax=Haematococcus lacustris TaxID=44745 RepID=A0A699ZVU9_HAELA|nr:hypothetical protein HaLaN_24160 [Haematococcus lacustris]